jgi:hypothetical protein
LQGFPSDQTAERVFCRVGICDTDAARRGVATPARKAPRWCPDRVRAARLPARDPAAPYRWDDVVAAMQKAGRTDAARYSPARAVALAPNSSPALLMAAGFHLDVGEHRQAFRLMSRSLQTSDAFDHAVFGDLDVRGVRADEILPCGSIR